MLARCGDLGGRQRPCAIQMLRQDSPADVPELDEDASARGVHGIRNPAPSERLGIGIEAGRAGPTIAFAVDRRCFGDEREQ